MAKNNLYVFNVLGLDWCDDASAAIIATSYQEAISVYGAYMDWDRSSDVFIMEFPILRGTVLIPMGYDNVWLDVKSIFKGGPKWDAALL